MPKEKKMTDDRWWFIHSFTSLIISCCYCNPIVISSRLRWLPPKKSLFSPLSRSRGRLIDDSFTTKIIIISFIILVRYSTVLYCTTTYNTVFIIISSICYGSATPVSTPTVSWWWCWRRVKNVVSGISKNKRDYFKLLRTTVFIQWIIFIYYSQKSTNTVGRE